MRHFVKPEDMLGKEQFSTIKFVTIKIKCAKIMQLK